MEVTEYITLGLIILGMFVEIAPVKWSPLNYIGKHLNRSTNERLDILEKHVDTIEIDAIRQRILSHDALIRRGEHLKQYQYEAIFKDINHWVEYHKKYPNLNGMIDGAIENIRETYKKEKFDI